MTLGAVRLLVIDSSETDTPKRVLTLSHGFQVVRVHALTVTAQVIHMKVIGDGANIALVHESVREPVIASVVVELPVPILQDEPGPFPASAIRRAVDVSLDSLNCWRGPATTAPGMIWW